MKKLLFTLGTLSVGIFPMMAVACSNDEANNGTSADDTDSGGDSETVDAVFHLDTLDGVTEIYNKFLSNEAVAENSIAPFTEQIYTFQIGEESITNTWTARDVAIINNAGEDTSFTFGDMGLVDATETMEEAFNNLPVLNDWDEFVGDAKDGWTNNYLYYAADELNADPNNDSGVWGDENIKGHPIYDKSLTLIEEAFGSLPENIDLYHVERGGDTAKNLYFKLIDRTTDEILDDSFKIDVKWNSTQEEIDNFDKGFFEIIKDMGAQTIGRAKELFNIITTKNDYTGLRDVIIIGIGLSFSLLVGIIWTVVRPFLGPFGTWVGATFVFRKLMEPAVEFSEQRVIEFLDSKYLVTTPIQMQLFF